MAQNSWTAVDAYINDLLLPEDQVLAAALADAEAAGLPAINVAPNQGKLLNLMARSHGAGKILEIGTLAGYSTIWLGRALPEGGKLISLEFNPAHASVAEANIARAGLSGKVEIRVGKALDTLPQLLQEGAGPFDMIFIDADKEPYCEYFQWSLKLSRPGTLIVADNVVRDGAIVNEQETDSRVIGIRRFNEFLAGEKRVSATILQTVGSKGYDGFAFALVNQ
ncbi:MAG TPA: O-methyltransferase [Chroococcales cyanobacterium]